MQITTDELRRMTNQEGLILQGCGGDAQEWIDGINELLTQEGILLEGTEFKHVKSFCHEGLTNLLFPFEGVKLDLGKLAIWRIKSHETFGGTWLSDYVPNRLGGFLDEAPAQKTEEIQQPEQRLILKKDMERLVWELEKAETELWQVPPDPILEKVAAMLSEDILEWSGTPTELAEALKLELKPNLLTKHLNVNASRLFHECHTQYENIRTHAGRRIILKRVSEQRDDA